jgi:hypothetical protein
VPNLKSKAKKGLNLSVEIESFAVQRLNLQATRALGVSRGGLGWNSSAINQFTTIGKEYPALPTTLWSAFGG